MTRMVNCVHLGREAEGLERPTYPGVLGVRIYEHVSKEAWGKWAEATNHVHQRIPPQHHQPQRPQIPARRNGKILLWRRRERD